MHTSLPLPRVQLVAGGKGLLAIGESNPICNARFAEAGIPQTEDVLLRVFDQLHGQRVPLEGMLLKPSMVLPGLDCPE